MSEHLSDVWLRATDLEVVSGSGCTVMSADGTEYLDFTAGIAVVNTGHCHPRVVAAIREQAARFIHSQVNCYRNPILESLAQRLAGVCPAGIDRFFFSNSGAEAVEAAVKLAKAATGRTNVVVFEGGFHGRTHMAMAMTTSKAAYRAGYQPLPAGVFVAPFPRPFEWGCDENEANRRALAALEKVFTQATAPHETAAVVIEPVLGEGGYLPAAAEFMRGVAGLCRSHEVLLVLDEVQTGFGRTGESYWCFEQDGVVPDAVVLSKGIGNGFPLAALVVRREVAEAMARRKFFNTYGASPMACAAGRAVLRAIADEGLQRNAREVGALFGRALDRVSSHPAVGQVRGRGLMRGIEFVRERATREPDDGAASRVQEALREGGVIVGRSGQHRNVLRINPPLCVTADDAAHFGEALEAAVLAVG